ncbi:formate acetyltransferase 1 [Salmonella enterica subsp. enterica]|uniref:Formate acetyltransferase 1 n=1 Tax=Salmonella enterica I TaxID=59201 RepID=A0A379WWZ5_SALET|nr:formate acetyltransferase 1 [Salmonella enterica subsp. enterica]
MRVTSPSWLGATDATTKLWDSVMEGVKQENRTHAPVDFDTSVASTITSHDAGYINKALEKIVGLQTEAPLKRAIIPFGGIKMVEGSCKAYNRELDPMIKKIFTEYRKTHNQGVFDVYTPDILRCRKSGVLTGLPDAYGRGRIIGDYRRVALYGIDYLMKDKFAQFTSLQSDLENGVNLEATIRLREEIAEQHRALGQIKEWRLNTAAISLVRRLTLRKQSSGLTSVTWLRLNLRTAQQCPSVVYPPSWMRTSNVT